MSEIETQITAKDGLVINYITIAEIIDSDNTQAIVIDTSPMPTWVALGLLHSTTNLYDQHDRESWR